MQAAEVADAGDGDRGEAIEELVAAVPAQGDGDTPTGIPSRSLNAAIDFRARRTLGCWPAIVAS